MGATKTKPLALPRSSRLLKHADFDRVYKQGQRHFSGLLTVFYLRHADNAQAPRVGFTVGKVLGGAVVRNRIRRRMREAVRLERSALTAPMDVVLHPKKAVAELEFEKLKAEVSKAFAAIQGKAARPQSDRPRSSRDRNKEQPAE